VQARSALGIGAVDEDGKPHNLLVALVSSIRRSATGAG